MKSIPAWLRWILILPASVFSYFVIQVIISIASSMDPFPLSDMVLQFANSIFGAYCFVWVGAKVAPKYSFITSIILSIVFTITIAIVTMIAVITRGYNPLWWLIITGVFGIVATIFACVHFYRQDKTSGNSEDSISN